MSSSSVVSISRDEDKKYKIYLASCGTSVYQLGRNGLYTSCLRYDERDTSPMPTRWPRNNERIWSAVVATGSSPSNRPRLSSLLRGLPRDVPANSFTDL